LWIRIRDPGSSAFLTPGSGIRDGKQIGSGFRIRIRDDQPGSYFRELRNQFFWVKILNLFDAYPGSGIEIIRIRDKHPGSATLGGGKGIDPQSPPTPRCVTDDRKPWSSRQLLLHVAKTGSEAPGSSYAACRNVFEKRRPVPGN